jgi:hypothetical protein
MIYFACVSDDTTPPSAAAARGVTGQTRLLRAAQCQPGAGRGEYVGNVAQVRTRALQVVGAWVLGVRNGSGRC